MTLDKGLRGQRAAWRWVIARWRQAPGLIALAMVALLERAVDDSLTVNTVLERVYPDFVTTADAPATIWDYPTSLLVIAAAICWIGGWWRIVRVLLIAANAVATAMVIVLIAVLTMTILQRQGAAGATGLLTDALIVWGMNGLIFSIWYWLLDGGGPLRRAEPNWRPDIIFPQQQQVVPGWEGWQPRFLDYVTLSFLINTTFNAAQSFLFARWAMILSIVQAICALILVIFLAARAIGALSG